VLSERGALIHHIDLSGHFFHVDPNMTAINFSCSIRMKNGIVTRVISGPTITACARMTTKRSTARPARRF